MAGRTLLVILAVSTPLGRAWDYEPCGSDTLGTYGAAVDSGGGFAELVGVVCEGSCFRDSAVYSDIAVLEDGYEDPKTAAKCQKLCEDYAPMCQVWTWRDGDVCELKRRMVAGPVLDPSAPLNWDNNAGSDIADELGISGSVNCEPYLPFPDSLRTVEVTDQGDACFMPFRAFGAGTGACGTAELLGVHGRAGPLGRGVQQGWWTDAQAVPTADDESVQEASACQAMCAARAGCAGFTLHYGLCKLYESPGCDAPFGRPESAEVAEVTVSGLRQGCVAHEEADPSWYDECDTPRCTTPPESALSVFLLGSTLRTEECYYDILDGAETRSALADQWVVVSGGSNAIVTAMAMANTLDTENLYHSKDGFGTGLADIVDIVWSANGTRTHFTQKTFAEASEGTISADNWNAVWDDRYITALEETLGTAPYEDGDTRLTLVVGQYWPNTAAVLDSIDTTPTAWQSADVVLYAQISQWYILCGVYDLDFCNNDDVRGVGAAATLNAFEDDFDDLMAGAVDICTPQGTSGGRKVTCLFASNCYDAGQAEAVEPFRVALRTKAAEYEMAHFLDFFGINGLKPEETVDAHATPFVHMWMWTIALNVALGGDVLPLTGCPEPLVAGKPCYAETYHQACDGCDCDAYESAYGGERWECLNSRRCDFRAAALVSPLMAAAAPPTGTVSVAACGHGLAAEALDSYSPEAETILQGCERRIWCSSDEGTAWGIAAAAFFVALAVFVLATFRNRARLLVCDPGYVQGSFKTGSAPPPPATVEIAALAVASTEPTSNDALAASLGRPDSAPTPPPSQPAAARQPAERLNALNVARFCASCHIVLGHMYAKGATDNVYLYGWGYTWVPWFFMLSGYVLTHARLASADPTTTDHPLRHLGKRLAGIYPAYAVGLALSLVARCARNAALPNFGVLMLQTLLLQTWSPTTAEQGLQMHCWFLSAMVLYWLCFGPVYRGVRRLSLMTSGVALAALAVPPWLLIIVPAFSGGGIDFKWYGAHDFGATESGVDLWVVALKFHPLAYAHVFAFGMVLARFRAHLRDGAGSPQRRFLARLCCSFGASIGYVGLFLVFLMPAVRPAAAKLSARLSILMPLQGLILLGLSPIAGWPTDPVTRAFLRLPQYLGEISYPQYVLQMVAYEFFPTENLTPAALVTFFLFLVSASSLLQELVARPGRVWWTRQAKAESAKANARLLGAPGALALVFALSALIYAPAPLAPEVVVVEENAAVDVLHRWHGGAGLKETVLINPSLLLFRPEYDATAFPHLYGNPADASKPAPLRLVRAARAHAMSTRREEAVFPNPDGTAALSPIIGTEITTTWASDLAFDETDAASAEAWKSWDVARWGLDGGGKNLQKSRLVSDLREGEPWTELCEPVSTYVPANRTMFRKVVLGPEDPKLVALPRGSVHGPYGVAFSSYPPGWTRPRCDRTYDAVQQMFFAAEGLSLARHDRDTPGVRLDCGFTRRDEKNWIAFTYHDQLHFVYSLHPHTVLSARALDGACEERWSTSSSKLLGDLAIAPGFRTHGSATAVAYRNAYLALMHTADDNGLYATFAYKFQAVPPFAVLAVSQPLPLQRSERAFASGLLWVEEADKVVVSYGVDNAEARSLVMSGAFLEGLFVDRCAV